MTRPAHQSTLGFTSASFFLRVPNAHTLSLVSSLVTIILAVLFTPAHLISTTTTTSLCVARSARQHRFTVFAHIRLRTVRLKDIRSLTQQNP